MFDIFYHKFNLDLYEIIKKFLPTENIDFIKNDYSLIYEVNAAFLRKFGWLQEYRLLLLLKYMSKNTFEKALVKATLLHEIITGIKDFYPEINFDDFLKYTGDMIVRHNLRPLSKTRQKIRIINLYGSNSHINRKYLFWVRSGEYAGYRGCFLHRCKFKLNKIYKILVEGRGEVTIYDNLLIEPIGPFVKSTEHIWTSMDISKIREVKVVNTIDSKGEKGKDE